MEQKSIEFIAFQLSKITGKLVYQFDNDYYENKEIYPFTRDINFFFDDADRYLELCEFPDFTHKEFKLVFKSIEIRNKALMILKSHDYLWDTEDDDTESLELYIHSYDKTAYDFIFGKSRSKFSIHQLSIILNTEILFDFTYPEYNCVNKIKLSSCSAINGTINFNCELHFKELNSIEDLNEFNKSLYIFLDLSDEYKVAKEINVNIIKE